MLNIELELSLGVYLRTYKLSNSYIDTILVPSSICRHSAFIIIFSFRALTHFGAISPNNFDQMAVYSSDIHECVWIHPPVVISFLSNTHTQREKNVNNRIENVKVFGTLDAKNTLSESATCDQVLRTRLVTTPRYHSCSLGQKISTARPFFTHSDPNCTINPVSK